MSNCLHVALEDGHLEKIPPSFACHLEKIPRSLLLVGVWWLLLERRVYLIFKFSLALINLSQESLSFYHKRVSTSKLSAVVRTAAFEPQSLQKRCFVEFWIRK
jgi:hypothetical protein